MTPILAAILFATGVCLTWMSAEPDAATPREASTRTLWRMELIAAAIVASVSFVWLEEVNPPPVGGRNEVFLTVVDCLLFEQCYTVGQGSSVLLNNGAVWPEMVLAIRFFGGTATDLYWAVIGLMAVGVALVFLIAARFASPAAAIPAAAFALALLGSFRFASPLIDCSITFLFSAAASAALLIFALSARPLALVIAAVFASHAVNSHVCAVVLLPALVVFSAMAGESRFLSVLLGGVSYLAASAVTSLQALTGNWVALTGAGLLWWTILGATLLLAAGIFFNPVYRRLAPTLKAAILAACLLIPYALGVLLLVAIGHQVRPEYLPPVIGPVSILAALMLAAAAAHRLPRQAGHWARFLFPMAVSLCLLSLDS